MASGVDLLTDLLHLCRIDEHDFDKALSMARQHHDAEASEADKDQE